MSFTRQAYGLSDAQPRAVQQSREQLMLALQPGQHRQHLIDTEHHGQAPPGHRTTDLLHPGQLEAQHLAVEKQECRQGLTMAGRRQPPV
jgi:hypothetical protein